MEKITYYKAFKEGLIDKYGNKREIGQEYSVKKTVSFKKNGFHMCESFEDCYQYFRPKEENVVLTETIGYGNFSYVTNIPDDRFNKIYIFEKMIIKRVIPREEIIEKALKLKGYNREKFLIYFDLTKEEIEIFKEAYKDDIKALEFIAYYQEGDKEVFKRRSEYEPNSNQRSEGKQLKKRRY